MAKKTIKRIRKQIRKTKKTMRGGGGNPLYGMSNNNNNYNYRSKPNNGYANVISEPLNPVTAQKVSALSAAKKQELEAARKRINSPLQPILRERAGRNSLLTEANELQLPPTRSSKHFAETPPRNRLHQHLPTQHLLSRQPRSSI